MVVPREITGYRGCVSIYYFPGSNRGGSWCWTSRWSLTRWQLTNGNLPWLVRDCSRARLSRTHHNNFSDFHKYYYFHAGCTSIVEILYNIHCTSFNLHHTIRNEEETTILPLRSVLSRDIWKYFAIRNNQLQTTYCNVVRSCLHDTLYLSRKVYNLTE